MEVLTLRDFIKSEDLLSDENYVTDGNILFAKEHLKAYSFWDKGLIKKLKTMPNKSKIKMELVPFEKGVPAYFVHEFKLCRGKFTYELMYSFRYKKQIFFFAKKYLNFIREYIKPFGYTLVYNSKFNMHILKFWDKENRFLGCLAPCSVLYDNKFAM